MPLVGTLWSRRFVLFRWSFRFIIGHKRRWILTNWPLWPEPNRSRDFAVTRATANCLTLGRQSTMVNTCRASSPGHRHTIADQNTSGVVACSGTSLPISTQCETCPIDRMQTRLLVLAGLLRFGKLQPPRTQRLFCRIITFQHRELCLAQGISLGPLFFPEVAKEFERLGRANPSTSRLRRLVVEDSRPLFSISRSRICLACTISRSMASRLLFNEAISPVSFNRERCSMISSISLAAAGCCGRSFGISGGNCPYPVRAISVETSIANAIENRDMKRLLNLAATH